MRRVPALALAAVLTATAVLAATAAAPATGSAQSTGLDHVETLIAGAAYADARSALDVWWSANESANLPGAERARALMFRARLAPDHAAAEAHYLSIVLGYPTSGHAPLALLRLGQGLLAAGEPERAAGYLQRLVADYPGRAERSTGLLWLARAHAANRQDAAACATARRAIGDVSDLGDADLVAMLRTEESVACAAAGMGEAPATEAARAARDETGTPPVTASTGRFSVQTGAFRQQSSVDAMVARLRRAGYQPRVVLVPANDLMRVRVGRFATREEAGRLVARLGRDGFDAIVTGDSDREREP